MVKCQRFDGDYHADMSRLYREILYVPIAKAMILHRPGHFWVWSGPSAYFGKANTFSVDEALLTGLPTLQSGLTHVAARHVQGKPSILLHP